MDSRLRGNDVVWWMEGGGFPHARIPARRDAGMTEGRPQTPKSRGVERARRNQPQPQLSHAETQSLQRTAGIHGKGTTPDSVPTTPRHSRMR